MESKSRALRLGLIEGSSDKDESADRVHAYESVGKVAETCMIRMKEFGRTKYGCLESRRLRLSYGRREWHEIEKVKPFDSRRYHLPRHLFALVPNKLDSST